MLCGLKVTRGWLFIVATFSFFLYITIFYDSTSGGWKKHVPTLPADFGTPPTASLGDERRHPSQDSPSFDEVAPLPPKAPEHAVPHAAQTPLETAVRPYPSDYLVPSKDNEWCESWYGPAYLERLAEQHTPYCEPDKSPSSLVCFRTHTIVELCLARGVNFLGPQKTSLNCQLRNFTQERRESLEKELALQDIKDVADMGEFFFGTGCGPQLRSWDISPVQTSAQDGGCSAKHNDGKYYLLVRREGNNTLWHKLMELWQAHISVDALQMSIDPLTNSPFLPSSRIPDIEVVFEDEETSRSGICGE